MTSAVQPVTETFMTAEAAQALAVRVRNTNFTFRYQVNARIKELTTEAGCHALDFLLQPGKVAFEQSAFAEKARADGLAGALTRYDGEIRHYCDGPNLPKLLRDVVRVIESLRDFHQEEARDFALTELTTARAKDEGKNRTIALQSHYKAEGTEEFVQMMRKAYADLLLPVID